MKTLSPPKAPPDLSRLLSLRSRLHESREDLAQHRERFQRIANRHENGTAPRAVVAHQLFQTPPALAARLASMLGNIKGLSVLEPSAGLGRLLDALAPYEPGEVVAVDQSPQCVTELHKRRDLKEVHHGDFLTFKPETLGLFDVVAMNPPFTMRSDIRHILHAREFLFPGGTLAALCMDTTQREDKLRHLCATWEKIPAGTFRSEGTEVPTVLLTMTN